MAPGRAQGGRGPGRPDWPKKPFRRLGIGEGRRPPGFGAQRQGCFAQRLQHSPMIGRALTCGTE
eukprot:4910453-Alexandrium_andersonii.AAC.1